MQIVCISSSNIKHAGQNSTSLKACKLICEIFVEKTCCDVKTEIITLADYEPKPCIGCGACFYKDKCVHDNEFNRIYSILCKADALFVISAHYAPIPSKLAMLLEKVEQIAFLKRFNDESYRSRYLKTCWNYAHGEVRKKYKYYIEPVINTIWNALSYRSR